MTTTEIDTTSIDYWTGLITEVVADKGEDYVYPRAGSSACYYQEYEEPSALNDWETYNTAVDASCIVGQVFYKHGERTGTLPKVRVLLKDSEDNNASVAFDLAKVEGVVEFDVPHVVIDAMVAAQEAQDAGKVYSEALQRYQSTIDSYLD